MDDTPEDPDRSPPPDARRPPEDEPVWRTHPLPVWLQTKYVAVALLAVLVVGGIVIAQKRGTWPPKPDCGQAAVRTSNDHAPAGGRVYWAATGPAGRYVVTFGAARLAGTADAPQVAEADPGASPKLSAQALNGCRALGYFEVDRTRGAASLRLFHFAGTGYREVARKDIQITG